MVSKRRKNHRNTRGIEIKSITKSWTTKAWHLYGLQSCVTLFSLTFNDSWLLSGNPASSMKTTLNQEKHKLSNNDPTNWHFPDTCHQSTSEHSLRQKKKPSKGVDHKIIITQESFQTSLRVVHKLTLPLWFPQHFAFAITNETVLHPSNFTSFQEKSRPAWSSRHRRFTHGRIFSCSCGRTASDEAQHRQTLAKFHRTLTFLNTGSGPARWMETDWCFWMLPCKMNRAGADQCDEH